MADYSITITNRINAFGPAPTTKWGSGSPYTMTWGLSKWGEGTEDLPCQVEKSIENSQTIDSSLAFDSTKHYSTELSATFEMSTQYLTDGSGYYYVFISPTTDGDDQVITSYSSQAAGSLSWTSGSVTASVWS